MTSADIHQLDSQYKPFPSFSEWQACSVDKAVLERHTALLRRAREKASPEVLERAIEIVRRAAAVDTGAIEGLYQVDRGFTLSVAMQTATWQSALETKGAKVRSMIESQLQVYNSVLDMATHGTPVVETWIRALHEQLCKAQNTYTVYTAAGPQEQTLPLGEYKKMPNHVLRKDGTTYSYAPVDATPHEMRRLMRELDSEEFLRADYVLQASYAHYAFVRIHPFADGNGRVARALASVYTYRAGSIPFLLLMQDKSEYLDSLEQADAGDRQRLVDFTLGRVIDAITLVSESIETAVVPQVDEGKSQIRDLYTTKGGYTQPEIDQAGQKLFEAFANEVNRRAAETTIPKMLTVAGGMQQGEVTWTPKRAHYRSLNFMISIYFRTEQPIEAVVHRNFVLEVPMDAGPDDQLIVQNMEDPGSYFATSMDDIWPNIRDFVHMRLIMFSDRVIGEGLQAVRAKAQKDFKPPVIRPNDPGE